MIIEFTHYVHDSLNSHELREAIETSSGHVISDELMERIGRPFYEVLLSCSLDTVTGAVSILRAQS